MSGNDERIKPRLGISMDAVKGIAGRYGLPIREIREEIVVSAVIEESFYDGCPRCAKKIWRGSCVGECGPIDNPVRYVWRKYLVNSPELIFSLQAAHRFPRLVVGTVYDITYVRALNDDGFLMCIHD